MLHNDRSNRTETADRYTIQTGDCDSHREARVQTSFPVESVDPELLPGGQMRSPSCGGLMGGVLEQPMEIQQL